MVEVAAVVTVAVDEEAVAAAVTGLEERGLAVAAAALAAAAARGAAHGPQARAEMAVALRASRSASLIGTRLRQRRRRCCATGRRSTP